MVTRVNNGRGNTPANRNPPPRTQQTQQGGNTPGAPGAAGIARPQDRTLTSEKVKELGLNAGWDQARIDAAIDKADKNDDNKFTAAEFDALANEMGAGADNAKVYADALLANPRFAKGWDAARQGEVQKELENRAKALLDTAADPTKTPQERLKAAQDAKDLVAKATKAARDAGYPGIATGLANEAADAKTAEQAGKIRTGDKAAFQQALKDAGSDPAKLTAIRDLLQTPEATQAQAARDQALQDLTTARDELATASEDPNANPLDLLPKLEALNQAQAAFDAAQKAFEAAQDPRAAVLTGIIDGKVSKPVADLLLAAMKDDKGGALEQNAAIKASGGNPADLEAVAQVLDWRADTAKDPATKAWAEKKTATIRSIESASEPVRKALANGFDGRTDAADFKTAAAAATTKEDLAALKAYADQRGSRGIEPFKSGDVGKRIDAVLANFDALKAEPGVWSNVTAFLGTPGKGNNGLLVSAALATTTDATLTGLQKVAEALGKEGKVDLLDKIAAGIVNLMDDRWNTAARDTRLTVFNFTPAERALLKL